ncbi:response regulator [Paraglaciecola sp. MB-3u-78]|uniref:response regulator n=1 Tax=Paraglaciecola sp. MB-3u-78 TaxID=2058332 RepID=UPI000C332E2B|nr:response regulator [Paraglaciecola sp. MB-3u-78]PKG97297.1 two-component system response regulator BaeR [Paraglaciecola sp. MB-3u-78]
MTKKSHVLIVEDEKKLASLLADYLAMSEYETSCLHDGLGVEPWLCEHHTDVILLDLMLPSKNGIEICKSIRQTSQVPIIMVTAKVEEIDRLLGLEIGADDYICKPFSPKEVVARVKALLRRSKTASSSADISLPFILDADRMVMAIEQQAIALTSVEFQMLSLLSSEPDRIFSRDQLMNSCYTDHRIVSDRTIDSHIKKLRKKMAVIGNENWIQSVYGVGYKLVV